MPSIQRFLLGLSLIGALFGWLGSAPPAFACSCVEFSPTEQFENATAVFVGTVKSISTDDGYRSVDFDVSESRKGPITESITVATGWGDADCGFNFETGREYLVYAYGTGGVDQVVYAYGEGQLSTSFCSGTSLLVADSQDGDGEGNITSGSEAPTAESDTQDYSIAPFVIVALISFGAGTLVAYLMGRKKKTL